jgi:glycerophosphoryl diester phosphodiesterase
LEWMAEAKRGNAAMEVGIPARTLTPEQLQEIARMGAQGVGIHFTCLTEELVRLCHRLGLAVRGWNPVTKQDIAYTIGFGVDGVTTDRPDIALELLGRLPGMPQ